MDCELDKILDENFAEHFRNIKGDFYKGVWLPQEFLKIADKIDNFKVRDDDVWVCSFPRSGTTWTQEMVWCICNDLDFEKAKISLFDRTFYLEYSGATTAGITMLRTGWNKKSIEIANQLPSPRFFKSHLPYHLLPTDLKMGNTKAKIVYITRNPKDVCISYYHLRVNTKVYHGTFENYCRLFLENRLAYTPYWEHLVGYCKAKDSNCILFLKFEDMKKNLPSIVKKTASFFNKSLSDDQISMLCDHLSYEKMKFNTATNCEPEFKYIQENGYRVEHKEVGFMRKGQLDQWKTDMSEELIKKFDHWIAKHLKDYPYLREHIS